ncbi:unnamed protein product [Klebsiella pneumoniae]|nr:unnamed protein product [Klebsiella pneumoniae]
MQGLCICRQRVVLRPVTAVVAGAHLPNARSRASNSSSLASSPSTDASLFFQANNDLMSSERR